MNYYEEFLFKPNKSKIKDWNPSFTDGLSKEEAKEIFHNHKDSLAQLQDKLLAHGKYALLIILQGMDASGKDGIVKHVMSGMNPHGFKTRSFSTPSSEEFSHDYLWRCSKELPARGQIAVFNRSYYEEVLIARIHPRFLIKQNLPDLPENLDKIPPSFWNTRFKDINNYEQYLVNNGIIVLKFFLHISKEEQRNRFLKRINTAVKNWKFKPDDIAERDYWDDYMRVYEEMMHKTSTSYAPWYVIPADNKWYSRKVICKMLIEKLESLKLFYPAPDFAHKRAIIEAKKKLLSEKNNGK